MYSTDSEERDVPRVFFACGRVHPVMTADAPAVVRGQMEAEPADWHGSGVPWRWLRGPVVRYRCERGHVQTFFLKSRFLDRPACWMCHARVWVTFPEDVQILEGRVAC